MQHHGLFCLFVCLSISVSHPELHQCRLDSVLIGAGFHVVCLFCLLFVYLAVSLPLLLALYHNNACLIVLLLRKIANIMVCLFVCLSICLCICLLTH